VLIEVHGMDAKAAPPPMNDAILDFPKTVRR
jgi:hypothetical protein